MSHHASPADRALRLQIRVQLRRLEAGLDRDTALEAIMAAIREREEHEPLCQSRTMQTVH